MLLKESFIAKNNPVKNEVIYCLNFRDSYRFSLMFKTLVVVIYSPF